MYTLGVHIVVGSVDVLGSRVRGGRSGGEVLREVDVGDAQEGDGIMRDERWDRMDFEWERLSVDCVVV